MSMSTCPRATDQRRNSSSTPHPINIAGASSQPPFLSAAASHPSASVPTSAFNHPSHETRPQYPTDYSVPRSQAYPGHENANAARFTSVNTGNDFDYQQSKHRHHPHLPASSATGGSFLATTTTLPPPPQLQQQPQPTFPLPSIAPSSSSGPMLSLTQQLPPLPLPPPIPQSAANLRRLSSSQQQPMGSRPPTASSTMGMSSIGGGSGGAGRMAFSPSRRNSNSNSNVNSNDNDPASSRPPTSHSRKSSQSSVHQFGGNAALQGRRGSGGRKSKTTIVKEEASASTHTLSPTLPKTTPSPSTSRPATGSTAMPAAAPAPAKSRRVRTGCLTCRERHLKCDENTPDCLNCRKGNRECKRGLRLNFIDIQTKPIPFVPPITEWSVSFYDESRQIASEYAGGLGRYPRVKDATLTPPPPFPVETTPTVKRRRPSAAAEKAANTNTVYNTSSIIPQAASLYPPNTPSAQSLQNDTETRNPATFPSGLGQGQITARNEYSAYPPKEEPREKKHAYQGSDASSIASSMVPQGIGGPSSVASFQAEVGNSPEDEPPRVQGRHAGGGIGNAGHLNDNMPEGLPTPPSEKTGILRGSGGAGGGGGGGGGGAGGAAAIGSGHGAGGAYEDIYNISGNTSNNGEREYLNSPDEVLFMQVFVEEVGVWMDSLDRDKHFSRIIPFVALKSPMMLNAFLACGVKHLTLVNEAYKDDKALFYYDTATTQLLRSLQNPDRDIVECATTAVVLNVYEIMSEKPNERMSHIAGARALIRECGWDARSKGIGAACFWLNIGMEVLSCLAFNWPTAWDPDQWGLDTSFATDLSDNNEADKTHSRRASDQQDTSKIGHGGHEESVASSRKSQHDNEASTSKSDEEPTTTAVALSAISSSSDEEMWVHRIFYIVAKIANFRAGVAPFPQEPSPLDHQVHMQNRFEEWKRLKRLCAIWNRDCPRSMRPFSYLFPSQGPAPASIFPNIWLIKRTAVIGRLFYHTAMVLLHQVDPDQPKISLENQDAQRHHAHQVCGIVAHTKDRGVASVAIRSLAISAHVLRDPREQDEVYMLLKKITAETGWRIGRIYTELQQVWGREIKDTPGHSAQATAVASNVSSSPSTLLPPPTDLPQPSNIFTAGFGQPNMASGGQGPGSASQLQKADFNQSASTMPYSSGGRRSLPMWSTSNTSTMLNMLNVHNNRQMHGGMGMAQTTASTPVPPPSHSPPSTSAPMPFRPPHMMNPLMHADFSLPDHPYKAFYKPPNDSAHFNSQPL